MVKFCPDINELCLTVGRKMISARSKTRLEDRWKNDEDDKLLQDLSDVYTLGQDLTLSSVPEVVDFLTLRDFPQLLEFEDGYLGPIFIPDSYIAARPTIISVDKGNLPAERSNDDLAKAIGDLAERTVYELLKEIFTDSEFQGSVVVIQGLDMLQINPNQRLRKHNREIDYLIIYKELGLIINIEVKNKLGPLAFTRKKVKQQLLENQDFFEEWFGADLSPDEWTWYSFVYSEENFPDDMAICEMCDRFIASGRDDLKKKLQKILTLNSANVPNEEFKLIVKYLVFCTPTKPLPIGTRHIKRLENAMEMQGSIENIKVWCFPTPEQRKVLSMDKVIFFAAWGTGKTLLMCAKAIEAADSDLKVLFLVFNPAYSVDQPSLLTLQLQLKFQDYPGIDVKQFNGRDMIDFCTSMSVEKYDCLMIDEFAEDFADYNSDFRHYFLNILKDKRITWLSLSGIYDKDEGSAKKYRGNVEKERVAKYFPGFEIARMKLPLRSPKKIMEVMRKHYKETGSHRTSLNHFLLNNSNMPPTLTEGKVVEFDEEHFGSFADTLKLCLQHVPEGKPSLFIVRSNWNHFVPTACQKCEKYLVAKTINFAFRDIGEKAPLQYLANYSSSKQEIVDWLNGKSDKHLVASMDMTCGYEHNSVINLAEMEFCMRSTTLVIMPKLELNYFYKALPLFEYCNSKYHDCNNLRKAATRHSPQSILDRSLSKLFLNRVAIYDRSIGAHPSPLLSAVLHIEFEEKEDSIIERFLEAYYPIMNLSIPSLMPLLGTGEKAVQNMQEFYMREFPEEIYETFEFALLDYLSFAIQKKIVYYPNISPRGGSYHDFKIFGQDSGFHNSAYIVRYRCEDYPYCDLFITAEESLMAQSKLYLDVATFTFLFMRLGWIVTNDYFSTIIPLILWYTSKDLVLGVILIFVMYFDNTLTAVLCFIALSVIFNDPNHMVYMNVNKFYMLPSLICWCLSNGIITIVSTIIIGIYFQFTVRRRQLEEWKYYIMSYFDGH